MKIRKNQGRRLFYRLALTLTACLLLILSFGLFEGKDGGRYEAKASAGYGDVIKIHALEVDMTVLPSRKVQVKEKITVEFLYSGLTMFYQSMPKDGAVYSDIVATCEGNEDFYYEVAENPDYGEFFDINCIGGAERGNTWTYDISYTMQQGVKVENGMIIDVVGFGSTVPIHNVKATVRFPEAVSSQRVFIGASEADSGYSLSEDGKILTVEKDVLDIYYNESFGEWVARGITVDFTLPEGVLVDYASSRVFTENMWKIAVGAGVCILLAFLCFLFRTKREVTTVVNVKPPKGMDPLEMGKILDGNADNEDITSMIYYFAHMGYLKINLDDEDDPELVRLVPALPEECPTHQHTLFEGLFEKGASDSGRVRISKLVTRFYEASENAKGEVQIPSPMYNRLSIFTFLFGGIVGLLYAVIVSLTMSSRLGGGYVSAVGAIFAIPIIVNLIAGYIRENYRYKWKRGKRLALWIVELVVSLGFAVLFIFVLGEHFMTEFEKFLLCLGATLPVFLTERTLSRTEEYSKALEDILGFKEFILVTEEDKIKAMLEENPELYYEVLPYAQVLGVTAEWGEKFKNITLAPPTWCDCDLTLFDYMLINRCITNSMARELTNAAIKASGGGHIGRGGGGGSFGGFGGGGFGGGGFGGR